MRVVALYFEKSQNTQGIAEIFYRATPQILLRSDQAIFLEISQCQKIYSEQSFLARTFLTLKKLQVPARVALAGDVATALALAFYGMASQSELPIEALRFYADPLLKAPEQSSKSGEIASFLRSLGVTRIGSFSHLPGNELASRFGSLGSLLHLRVNGQMDIPWQRFTPTESVVECREFDLEHPAENLETIYFCLRPLLDRVLLRLYGRGRRARQFEVILRQEHAPAQGFQDYTVLIVLQLPHVTMKSVFQIVKEKLDAQIRARPLEHRILSVSIRVTEEVPYHMVQKDIFDQKREENAESFFQLISRLATRLGPRSVFFARAKDSYLPEKNWLRVPELEHGKAKHEQALAELRGQVPIPERPLRLFQEPIPVRLLENRIILPRETDQILKCDQYEIVLADWWDDHPERAYFRVKTKKGKELWVFKSQNGYFLHGVFD